MSREEKIYECDVKRIRIVNGKRYFFWKVKTVREALEDEDKEFRCKDCRGEVKLFRRHVAHAAAPHVEHKRRQDSEYCPAGMYFKMATDERTPRLSEFPVV
ncbi:MAG TPA: hypothetical protein VGN16_16115 [Acidobacteriaceae bacterium]|jgi:hypothetical protein